MFSSRISFISAKIMQGWYDLRNSLQAPVPLIGQPFHPASIYWVHSQVLSRLNPIGGTKMSKTDAAGANVKGYEPSRRLAAFHIRGFQHWDGALVISDMRVGDSLDLIAEMDNPYDPQAVAVYFKGVKLGYVPANENELFSTMFHFGHADAFEARVMQVDPEADPWNQVRMGIFVADVR